MPRINKSLKSTSIAQELLSMLEVHLLHLGIYAIDLLVSTDNLRATRFYEKMNFYEKRKLMQKDMI